jgi:hypothetical protein
MSINKTRQSVQNPGHTNPQGGVSFDIKNPLIRLQVAASSCFFGEPQFYVDGSDAPKKGHSVYSNPSYNQSFRIEQLESLFPKEWYTLDSAQMLERAIDDALDFDARATLKYAGVLRNEEHIRVTPQVILVRAAHHPRVRGTSLVREFAPQIIKRADEPATGLAYHLGKYGKDKPVPNSLKRAWRRALAEFSEYNLAKYRMENRQVKTVDVVNLVHPVRTEAINKLVRGELKLSVEDTWEALISKEGSNQTTWSKAVNIMGHMALLRNLRNLAKNNVDPAFYCSKLVEGSHTGQQLPFRYLSAFKALEQDGQVNPRVQDAIEEALLGSIQNLPRLPGRVLSIADVSGSMTSTCTSSLGTTSMMEIASLSSVIAAQAGDEGYAMSFASTVSPIMGVRKRESILAQAKKIQDFICSLGGGTNFSEFWKKLVEEKYNCDFIFVFSDMQAGDDHESNKWIKRYRSEVNPNVHIFLTQVAGQQHIVTPEIYNRTYVLGGWSENVIKFAAKISGLLR